VSEAYWFWHPGEGSIRGVAVAKEMDITLFDYVVSVDGDTLTMDLTVYDPKNQAHEYVEKWEFTDEDHYRWGLFTESDGELNEVMSGVFTRTE
jgi:hypothetical protein